MCYFCVVAGIFLRKVNLLYKQLSFMEIVTLQSQLAKYCSNMPVVDPNEVSQSVLRLGCFWIVEGGGWSPDRWMRCGEKGEVEMKWSRWGSWGGEGQRWEWELGREGVEVDLQWRQTRRLWETLQELGYLKLGQVREMCGAAEEVSHRVIGGVPTQ